MTTGFGNEHAKDAVRRTLIGGSSGRVAVFVMVAAFLALGIYADNLLLTVAAGIAAVPAIASLAWKWRGDRAARRLGRSRGPD